ncbi:brevican core protein-like [Oculina patagonica]
MRCKKVLLIFFLFQTTFVFAAEETPTFSRSSYFRTLENMQLKGYVVKRFDSPSLLSCGQQCMRNEWCTSTNYKMSFKKDGKGTCELNKHDIFLINENTHFHDQQGVTFSMFLKVNRYCSQAWVLHGNSCYHVNDTPTLSWSDARTTCKNLGGDLAIVRSEDENNFIRDLVMKQQTVQDLGAWIGLHRKADTKFYWIDDTPLDGRYDAWGDGQPSRLHEKCVHAWKEGEWNDIKCNLSEAHMYKAPVVLCQKKSTFEAPRLTFQC